MGGRLRCGPTNDARRRQNDDKRLTCQAADQRRLVLDYMLSIIGQIGRHAIDALITRRFTREEHAIKIQQLNM